MSLRSEIDAKRREISSENLSMSIGELLNMYKEQELDIHPEFQRIFRWEREQKSRLIESLLLGIPLPSIYVATNEDGIWEVIDGVQRLSTIFEFMGELKGPSNDSDDICLKPALVLEKTKYLPGLDGVTFESLDQALRLEFKRTRLDIKILAREAGQSSGKGKFDLFERLNTYGQPLSQQELRNCILVSLNPPFFRWLQELAKNENFRNSTLLSEAQLKEKYDMDLVLRFITLRGVEPSAIGDVHDYLREKMETIAADPNFDLINESRIFKGVFKLLDGTMAENSFRPWNPEKSLFRGGFSLAAYEGISLALGKHWDKIDKVKSKLEVGPLIKAIWSDSSYRKSFSGLRARERMTRVVPAAEALVLKEIESLAPRRAPK